MFIYLGYRFAKSLPWAKFMGKYSYFIIDSLEISDSLTLINWHCYCVVHASKPETLFSEYDEKYIQLIIAIQFKQ